jgi:prepilin-type N-terminal cleavage/methylation domain-containing protein
MNHLRLKEEGFTLIELLVVIAIIGILAAIAIPQFAAYRRRSFEAQVKSDLHNAAVAQEAYFVNANHYAGGAINTNLQGYNQTATVTMTAVDGTSTFILTGTHQNCSGVTWSYSSVGGVVAGPPAGCP